MGRILTFKSENINLDCIPIRSTIKLETMARSNNVLDDNIMKALVNENATNENKFLSTDEFLEIVNGKILNIPGFPKIFDTDSEFTIPETGWYRIIAVGGGGSGAVRTARQVGVAKDSDAATATSIKIGNITLIAEGGVTATSEKGAVPLIPYNGWEGATKGGDPAENGEDGVGKGGDGYHKPSRRILNGGGGGSPFPYNHNKKYGKNGVCFHPRSQGYHALGECGLGYGAGANGMTNEYSYGSGATIIGSGGGSSGYLITKDMILIKGEKIKITIGRGAKGVTIQNPETTSGTGANGAVAIELLK